MLVRFHGEMRRRCTLQLTRSREGQSPGTLSNSSMKSQPRLLHHNGCKTRMNSATAMFISSCEASLPILTSRTISTTSHVKNSTQTVVAVASSISAWGVPLRLSRWTMSQRDERERWTAWYTLVKLMGCNSQQVILYTVTHKTDQVLVSFELIELLLKKENR